MRAPEDLQPRTISWKLLIIFWLVIVTINIVRVWFLRDSTILFLDTDDAMRMVGVRDLLAGQSWSDNTQYRANTPFGHEMHWSRLVDAPLVLLTILLTPLAGANAYLITSIVWPLLLLFILLYLSARLSVRLAGRQGQIAAITVPLILLALLPEFAPGRIDHHNVQILLSLTMLVCAIEARTSRFAALVAGVTCAISICIGLDSIIFIALTILIFGLFWVWRGASSRGRLVQFGLGFAVPTAIVFFSFTPPANFFRPDCDALSVTYLTIAVLIGAVFCLCAALTQLLDHPAKRFAAIAVGGLAVGLIGLLFFPHCLGGPLVNIDAELKRIWIDNVTEARSILLTLKLDPANAIAMGFAPLFGLAITLWLAITTRQLNWALVGLYLGTALIITLFQVRGIRLAAIFCVPAAAYLIGAARARYLITNRPSHTFGLIAAWLAFAGIIQFIPLDFAFTNYDRFFGPDAAQGLTNKRATVSPNKKICYLPANYQKLAAMAPARIIAPIDLGAHILLFTDHAIVAAPYHRNGDGLHDAFDFFNKPQQQARQIAAKRGLTHLVTCEEYVQATLTDNPAPDSVGKMLSRDETPDWLRLISPPDEPIQIYQIDLQN